MYTGTNIPKNSKNYKNGIIIFFPRLLSNGTEKAILDLIKDVHRDWRIVYNCDDKLNDVKIINQLSEFASVEKWHEGIECDICIYATQYFKWQDSIIKANKHYQWVHNMPFAWGPNVINDKEYTKIINLFICVSDASKEELEYYDSDFNVITIHNFLDSMDIVEKSKEEVEKDFKTKKSLTIVGRISSEKGVYRIGFFANKIPDWQINIIGTSVDEEYERLTKLYLKQFPNVRFLGYKDNPFKYIANSTYLLCLSEHEGWNRTITEARILGIPIITTDFSSAKEQVVDGLNGYIFDMDFNRDIKIIEDVPKYDKLVWHNEIEKWEKIL